MSLAIRDRIKELRRVKASELAPNPLNWRTHPKEQADALRGLLAEVGIAGAVLAREQADGTLQLIDGHLRAETLGDKEIPVLILDVDQDEAAKILATYDPLGAMAGSDAETLAELLKSVSTDSDALQKMIDATAEASGVISEVAESQFPELETGDRQPFQQMTFTLHDDQIQTINDAIGKAKQQGGGKSEVNENSNGNALATIAEAYLGIG